MFSRSGLPYLERQRLLSVVRVRPRYQQNALKSHFRPVRHLPALLSSDPPDRVLTVDDRERIPYLPVTGPDA